MKNKKGMSLIVLVITILVMIILAGVVVTGLSSNNPIAKANEATFKSDAGNFRQELSLSLAKKLSDDPTISSIDVNASSLEEIREYIPSFSDRYEGVFEIKNGQLVYIGEEGEQKDWSENIGIVENAEDSVDEYFNTYRAIENTYIYQKSIAKKGNIIFIPGYSYVDGVTRAGGSLVNAATGEKIISNYFGENAYINDGIMLNNGNVALVGKATNGGAAYLVIADQNLNAVKEIRVDGNYSEDQFQKVLQLPTGEIIAFAEISSVDLGFNNPSHACSAIYKYTENGEFIEKREIAPAYNGSQIIVNEMKILSNGDIMLVGSMNYNFSGHKFAMVRVNPTTLDTVYARYYTGQYKDKGYGVIELDENTLAVFSTYLTTSYNTSYIMKINSANGDILSKTDIRERSESEAVEQITYMEKVNDQIACIYQTKDISTNEVVEKINYYNKDTLAKEAEVQIKNESSYLAKMFIKEGNTYYVLYSGSTLYKFKEN